MIYAYYGGKSGLFDATLTEALGRMAENVPPRPEDLAGWAGDVFDHHQRFPEVLRLSMWAQLERPEATAEPLEVYRNKALAVATAAARPVSAVDVLVFIYAIAQAWQLSPKDLPDLRSTQPAVMELPLVDNRSSPPSSECCKPNPESKTLTTDRLPQRGSSLLGDVTLRSLRR